MKRETITNVIDAHGWVGLVVSIPLFIIFWCGAVTLFYPEVQGWTAMPHFPLQPGPQQPLDSYVDNKLQAYDVDPSRAIVLRLPSDRSHYVQMSIPVYEKPENREPGSNRSENNESEGDEAKGQGNTDSEAKEKSDIWQTLIIDPRTGETLAKEKPFKLADFLNHLHFTLELPQGLYIVGLVTFFFLVLVFTGIVVQFKNLIRHFFLYRHNKATRYQMNDLHNVVGVISLPYGLMYAVTGLMFNLGILFQLPTMFVLYDGDREAMFKDGGFANVKIERANISYPMPDLDALIQQVEARHDTEIHSISLQNYGDENAIIRLSGSKSGTFAKRLRLYYQVKTQDFPKEFNPTSENRFADGISLLFSIHMANFAQVDLRFVYFLLAMGVCGMIVAGNVLWLAKREKSVNYPKTMAIMRGITLGGCMGILVATALAFLLERALPVEFVSRSDVVSGCFGVVLLVCILTAFRNTQYKQYVGYSCLISAGLLLLLVLVDAVIFGSTIVTLWHDGFVQVAGVSLGLLVVSVLLTWIGLKTLRPIGHNSLAVTTVSQSV